MEDYLTVDELAERLRVDRDEAMRRIRRGDFAPGVIYRSDEREFYTPVTALPLGEPE